ncbi:hypothetical protein DFA_09083 [Cavenderia fasciculata]|uniref:Uncharacterized protein n=1 Tax=Cavenderia fasciculata TaxID=261658 RepID=F4Q6M9_CACFS|nr:uncharacterized protein DFA_09083 [Cavenderia fasciculata]EGG16539.1 hypothetical protein DFA_09083 [Cavenderia fasciculata]|eukprot:XP_004354939.1 hypothetical protein DFA_09083 [Cavenderia fasciculata]
MDSDRLSELYQMFQHAKRQEKISKNVIKGKRILAKRLNIARGRPFYPARIHRKAASQPLVVRNTAFNALNNGDISGYDIIVKMADVKKRDEGAKMRVFMQNIMKQYGMEAFQNALLQNGVDENYNEDEDEDFEPPSDEDEDDSQDEEEEESGSEEEEEEEQQKQQTNGFLVEEEEFDEVDDDDQDSDEFDSDDEDLDQTDEF